MQGYSSTVQVSETSSGAGSRLGYILTPKDEEYTINRGWILVIFEATTVIQIVRNSWDSSMENLVRHLVRHRIQFRTLVPASQVIPNDILRLHKAPLNFTTIPPMTPGVMLNAGDYTAYVQLRRSIIRSPHGRAAFRMGDILWRLAMEAQENFDDLIDEILEGPSELGPASGEYLYLDGNRFYDDLVRPLVADTICGTHGMRVGRHQTIRCQ